MGGFILVVQDCLELVSLYLEQASCLSSVSGLFSSAFLPPHRSLLLQCVRVIDQAVSETSAAGVVTFSHSASVCSCLSFLLVSFISLVFFFVSCSLLLTLSFLGCVVHGLSSHGLIARRFLYALLCG